MKFLSAFLKINLLVFFALGFLFVNQSEAALTDEQFNAQYCLTINANVTVTNLPKGKKVWLGCDGDGGSSNVGAAGLKNVCSSANMSKDHNAMPFLTGSDGVKHKWCYGDGVDPLRYGGITGGKTTVNHCSCPYGKSYADGCLKVYITDSNKTPKRACSSSDKPKIKIVLNNYSDNDNYASQDQYFATACRAGTTANNSAINYKEFMSHSIPHATQVRNSKICGTNGVSINPNIKIPCTPPAVSCNVPAVMNVKITCPTCTP